ncbi:outer membrane lipoprotein carrier protein LolA [Ideonella azotifigens]|nr:outer membrane lipoprotein carrier protein LolA [Ideonella azotifigens]MCD2338795.1 outer membrane lipoprotein carrier protein LolA [Ideonella azotifigens]
MKRRDLLIAATAVATGLSWADDGAALVRELQSRLTQPAWLHGEFEQVKEVPGFKKPLVSRGDFVVARSKGVLWRTRQPFASELRLTRDQVRASQSGVTSFQLDASREPALRTINALMFALLNGEMAGLAELFTLQAQLQPKTWQLSLTPRQPALQQFLQRIELEGDAFVRRLVILETSGDRSTIAFSNLRADAAPGAGEAGLFE